MLTKGIVVLDYSAQPNSAAATVNFLNSWGLEIFPHPPCSPHLLSRTSVCSQRWKSTFEVSISTLAYMFKMKSRTGYVARILFCVWRTWQIDTSLWYVSTQTFWLCREVKLIWGCI
jgi:hypothetical protein